MTTMTKKQTMRQRIEKHGENLNKIFKTEFDAVELCKKLKRLEVKAHHATTCLCNTNTLNLMELNIFTGYDVKQATEDEQDAFFEPILESAIKILGEKARNIIFINFDPRGYAFKIKPEAALNENIEKDWGGYGIIAPDFSL